MSRELIERLRLRGTLDTGDDDDTALLYEAAAALEQHQWVPVSERLPEPATWSGDTVLVFTEEGYIQTGLYEDERAGEWYDKFNDSGFITHWMPLPPPPEDKA